ncbi:MAG: hypothetical protein C4313_06380 [Thermoflexus sp.]
MGIGLRIDRFQRIPIPIAAVQALEQPVGLLDGVLDRLDAGLVDRVADLLEVHTSSIGEFGQGAAAPQLGGERLGGHPES